jgi:hypothetical protein
MLEIRITPQKMFVVLSNFLDEPQAKSIILDLLLEMDGQPLTTAEELDLSLLEAAEADEVAVADEATPDGTGKKPVAVKAPKPRPISKSRRVSFSAFGGKAQGLLGNGDSDNDEA